MQGGLNKEQELGFSCVDLDDTLPGYFATQSSARWLESGAGVLMCWSRWHFNRILCNPEQCWSREGSDSKYWDFIQYSHTVYLLVPNSKDLRHPVQYKVNSGRLNPHVFSYPIVYCLSCLLIRDSKFLLQSPRTLMPIGIWITRSVKKNKANFQIMILRSTYIRFSIFLYCYVGTTVHNICCHFQPFCIFSFLISRLVTASKE